MILRLYFLDYGKDLDVPTKSEIPEEDIEEEIRSLQKENPSKPSKESHPGLERLFNTRETSTLTDHVGVYNPRSNWHKLRTHDFNQQRRSRR